MALSYHLKYTKAIDTTDKIFLNEVVKTKE